MKLLIKITAFVTVAIMATSALPTGGVDLTSRQELDPPFCVPCPPEHYCNCDGSPKRSEPEVEIRQANDAYCQPCEPGVYFCECIPYTTFPPFYDELDEDLNVSSPVGSTRDTNADDPNLFCFPLSGTGVEKDYYVPKVSDFCSTLSDGNLSLPDAAGYSKTYNITVTGAANVSNSVALSLNNSHCTEDAYFDYTKCEDLFDRILTGCNRPGGLMEVNVGGSYFYGCGHAILQHSGVGQ